MQAARKLNQDLYNVGVALAGGESDAARVRLAKLERQFPGHPEIVGMSGRLAMTQGRLREALPLLQRAAAARGSDQNLIWLAICLTELGRRAEAFEVFDRLGDAVPDSAPHCLIRIVALHAMGQTARAIPYAQRMIALTPQDDQGHAWLGSALRAAGRPAEAIPPLAEAIRLNRTQGRHYIDLGAALSDCGEFVQALHAAELAVLFAPDRPEAHNNMGHALLNLNRSREAIAPYDRALALQPDYGAAAFGRASALLKCGDYRAGWTAFESRWNGVLTPRGGLTAPLWQGEPRAGRTLLVHCEQGFGDSLQFARFIPRLDSAEGKVIFEVPSTLHRLFTTLAGEAELVEHGSPLPPHDLHCPLVSLPHCLDCGGDVAAEPYLSAGPFAEQAAPIPASAPNPRPFTVGLVWSGDPRPHDIGANLIDRRRSLPFASLGPLLEIDHVRFVSFQHGSAAAQRAGSVADAIAGVTDFASTAARLDGIDLLISVDTSMVHLAGAIGRPVWMLSRFDACWRWGDAGESSAWYPRLRIFRQPTPGAWGPVVAEVADALRQEIGVLS